MATINGTSGADNLFGTPGDDAIYGQGGDDRLYGFDGNDVLVADLGGNGVQLYGGRGNDIYIVGNIASLTIHEEFDEGIDWEYLTVGLSLHSNVENGLAVPGFNVSIAGNSLANLVIGNEFAQTLTGEAGNDILEGRGGGDGLSGGADTDAASYSSAPAAVTADLQTIAANTGHAFGDSYSDIENLFGSAFGDTLRGNGAANYLKGEAGNDTLVGRLGRDVLAGGTGNDSFLFNGVTDSGTTELTRDVITDFVKGQDRMNLAAIDANAATGANDAFGLLAKGTSASPVATGKAGWYWYDPAGTINDKTILRINNDGDGTIEMTIELRGLITLAATDFNL